VRDPDREEVHAPVTRSVGGELHVPALVRHAGDDLAEARPGVEPAVDEGPPGVRSRTSTAASVAPRRRPGGPDGGQARFSRAATISPQSRSKSTGFSNFAAKGAVAMRGSCRSS
jgi:hypothetical protein